MGTDYKNVRLTADAYAKLQRRKREDETFSEVVARLAAERPIADLDGVFTDESVEYIRERRHESYARYAGDRGHE